MIGDEAQEIWHKPIKTELILLLLTANLHPFFSFQRDFRFDFDSIKPKTECVKRVCKLSKMNKRMNKDHSPVCWFSEISLP